MVCIFHVRLRCVKEEWNMSNQIDFKAPYSLIFFKKNSIFKFPIVLIFDINALSIYVLLVWLKWYDRVPFKYKIGITIRIISEQQ